MQQRQQLLQQRQQRQQREQEEQRRKAELKAKKQQDSVIGNDCNESSLLTDIFCCNPHTGKVIEIPLADKSGERYGQSVKYTLRLPLRKQSSPMCKTVKELRDDYHAIEVSKKDKLRGLWQRRGGPLSSTARYNQGRFFATEMKDKLAQQALIESEKLYETSSVHGSGGGKKKSPKRKSKRNNRKRNNKKK